MFDTPFTSAVGSAECTASIDIGVAPYSGAVCRDPPLLVALHYVFRNHQELQGLVWIALDCGTAALIGACAVMERRRRGDLERSRVCAMTQKANEAVSCAPLVGSATLLEGGSFESAMWMLNPVAIVACSSGSNVVLHHGVVVCMIYALNRQQVVTGVATMVTACYLNVYYGFLIIPVALSAQKRPVTLVVSFLCTGAALLLISFEMEGSWHWLDVVHGGVLRVEDYTPNTGLCWYLFTVMFPHFQQYFLCLVHCNTFVVIVLMSVRFRNDALFLVTILLGITAVLKTYPTMSDFSLVLVLLSIRPELTAFLSFFHLAICTLVVLFVLVPVFWHTWIYDVGGNSNFFYALTLAYAATQCIVLNDHLRAHLTLEHTLRIGVPRERLKLK